MIRVLYWLAVGASTMPKDAHLVRPRQKGAGKRNADNRLYTTNTLRKRRKGIPTLRSLIIYSHPARNDTLQHGGGDPQKQAPSCREVSPDALGVIGQHLRSIEDESSSPAASGMNDNEDGGTE
jgi:hypothetical protein